MDDAAHIPIVLVRIALVGITALLASGFSAERAGFDARRCMASGLALFLPSPPLDSERHTGNPDLLTNTLQHTRS